MYNTPKATNEMNNRKNIIIDATNFDPYNCIDRFYDKRVKNKKITRLEIFAYSVYKKIDIRITIFSIKFRLFKMRIRIYWHYHWRYHRILWNKLIRNK